jgi:hypothetical protein
MQVWHGGGEHEGWYQYGTVVGLCGVLGAREAAVTFYLISGVIEDVIRRRHGAVCEVGDVARDIRREQVKKP